MSKNIGVIKQVIGAVGGVAFEENLPQIYDALEVMINNKKLTLETQQHLGGGVVRSVAMSSTDGLQRGQEVLNTGMGISVPVGKETLGRVLDVLGEPVDGAGEVKTAKKYPIHRATPAFTSQSTKTENLETRIKIIYKKKTGSRDGR